MARGLLEIGDLLARAEHVYADAREQHLAAKLDLVERLASPGYRHQSGMAIEDLARSESPSGAHSRFEQRWPPGRKAPQLARTALIERFGAALSPAERQRVKLAVSELVTNAVVHGTGEVMMQADLDRHRLRVEVIDEGPGFAYHASEVPLQQLSHRGLAIVDALTSDWGIREDGARVWFELLFHSRCRPG